MTWLKAVKIQWQQRHASHPHAKVAESWSRQEGVFLFIPVAWASVVCVAKPALPGTGHAIPFLISCQVRKSKLVLISKLDT